MQTKVQFPKYKTNLLGVENSYRITSENSVFEVKDLSVFSYKSHIFTAGGVSVVNSTELDKYLVLSCLLLVNPKYWDKVSVTTSKHLSYALSYPNIHTAADVLRDVCRCGDKSLYKLVEGLFERYKKRNADANILIAFDPTLRDGGYTYKLFLVDSDSSLEKLLNKQATDYYYGVYL